jgi:hypothetical protein
MSNILKFPCRTDSFVKNTFDLGKSKVIYFSDYQKQRKATGCENDLRLSKNSLPQVNSQQAVKHSLCVEELVDADKAIYFSSFISF